MCQNGFHKEKILCENAPKAIGPYSQAIRAGGFVFVSGQIPLNPKTGELVKADISEQTKTVLMNLKSILEEAGSSIDKVLKTTIYLIDLNDFVVVNEIYGEMFKNSLPARSCVEASRLPKDVMIEIEAIGIIED